MNQSGASTIRSLHETAPVAVQAVVFDLGETLVDESQNWARWADWLGVRPLDLFPVLGAMIERREDHRRAFELLKPGFDLERERAAMDAAGAPWRFDASDLYPDAVPCLERLRAAGLRIGIVGNQPAGVESMLEELHGLADVVGSSGRWGVEKPSAAFFERVAAEIGLDAEVIAYVGDRVDNDVVPAAGAGMVAVFIRRGPWAWIQTGRVDPPEAALTVESLAELPEALRRLSEPPATSPPSPSGG
jgi:HAD superfamily hydrolase (TIGR01549 family)